MKCSLVLLLLVSLNIYAQNPAKYIPDFVFFKPDNTPFNKGALIHRTKSLFVFFDSDCEHCQHAAQKLARHYNDFNQANIYLVTLDNTEKINQFMKSYCPGLLFKRNVTLLLDLRNEFISKFNPRKYPSMLLYSRKGKLLDYEDDENNMDRLFKCLPTR